MNNSHDEKGRFAPGKTSTGVTNTVRERQAMRAMVDRRKFAQTRTSNRNLNPTPMRAMDIPHTRGIVAATQGKTLAQTSAAGTNQSMPPPKIGGN
jgi:hypothetical protein